MTDSSNLDLVRSIFARWEHGDYSSVAWAHPQIEFVICDGPSPGTWSGVAGMTHGYREVMNAWEGYGGTAEAYRELDNERVLVMVHLTGRGKTSGVDLAQVQPNGAGIFHVRADKVTKIVLYWDRDRALADLGLEK